MLLTIRELKANLDSERHTLIRLIESSYPELREEFADIVLEDEFTTAKFFSPDTSLSSYEPASWPNGVKPTFLRNSHFGTEVRCVVK